MVKQLTGIFDLVHSEQLNVFKRNAQGACRIIRQTGQHTAFVRKAATTSDWNKKQPAARRSPGQKKAAPCHMPPSKGYILLVSMVTGLSSVKTDPLALLQNKPNRPHPHPPVSCMLSLTEAGAAIRTLLIFSSPPSAKAHAPVNAQKGSKITTAAHRRKTDCFICLPLTRRLNLPRFPQCPAKASHTGQNQDPGQDPCQQHPQRTTHQRDSPHSGNGHCRSHADGKAREHTVHCAPGSPCAAPCAPARCSKE